MTIEEFLSVSYHQLVPHSDREQTDDDIELAGAYPIKTAETSTQEEEEGEEKKTNHGEEMELGTLEKKEEKRDDREERNHEKEDEQILWKEENDMKEMERTLVREEDETPNRMEMNVRLERMKNILRVEKRRSNPLEEAKAVTNDMEMKRLMEVREDCLALRHMLFLAVAFSANTGGTGSPLGCGPNIVLMGLLDR